MGLPRRVRAARARVRLRDLTFLRFVDRARAAGVEVPIVPGILPINRFAAVRHMAKACGTRIPPRVARLFEGLDDRPETRALVAATVAADLCRALADAGVRRFHFYTLNRAEPTRSLCHLLGAIPSSPEPEARAA